MGFHRRAIACYLALCLALGGMAGFSPLWHHVIEHGGDGRPHVHGRHAHPQSPPVRSTQKLFAHPRPFDLPLPKIDFAKMLHALEHLAGDLAAEPPDGESNGHEHHSLAQLLASGLIDQEISFEVLPPAAIPAKAPAMAPSDTAFLAWNPEPPGRAPPSIPS